MEERLVAAPQHACPAACPTSSTCRWLVKHPRPTRCRSCARAAPCAWAVTMLAGTGRAVPSLIACIVTALGNVERATGRPAMVAVKGQHLNSGPHAAHSVATLLGVEQEGVTRACLDLLLPALKTAAKAVPGSRHVVVHGIAFSTKAAPIMASSSGPAKRSTWVRPATNARKRTCQGSTHRASAANCAWPWHAWALVPRLAPTRPCPPSTMRAGPARRRRRPGKATGKRLQKECALPTETSPRRPGARSPPP